jgi:hypothetical protein
MGVLVCFPRPATSQPERDRSKSRQDDSSAGCPITMTNKNHAVVEVHFVWLGKASDEAVNGSDVSVLCRRYGR